MGKYVALFVLILISTVSFSVNISACTNISSPGIYNQTANLTGAPISVPDAAGGFFVDFTCIRIDSSDVVYDCGGNKINNTGSIFSRSGIAVVGPVDNVTVRNCNISNYIYNVLVYSANDSSFMNNPMDNHEAFLLKNNVGLYNNLFVNNTGNSIILTDIGSGFPVNNSVINNTFNVIFLTGHNNTIENNSLLASSTFSIGLRGPSCSGNTVRNNDITSFDGTGIDLMYCDGNTVENNFVDPPSIGINVFASSNNTIRNNTILSATSYGIYVPSAFPDYSLNNTFIGNNVSNSTFSGFYVYFDNNLTAFYNNTANDNGWAGGFGSGFEIYSANTTMINNTAYNNSFYGISKSLHSGDIIVNNTLQENGFADLNVFLSFPGGALNCDATITGNTGSGDRPIGYYDDSILLADSVFSELILCDADDSVVDNVTIIGSDTLFNNFLHVMHSENVTINNSNSSFNLGSINVEESDDVIIMNSVASFNAGNGFEAEQTNLTAINNTAYNNDGNGFGIEGESLASYIFVNNTAFRNGGDGFELEGVASFINWTNNTAYRNSANGFEITFVDPSAIVLFTSNTAYDNSAEGFSVSDVVDGSSVTFTDNIAHDNDDGFDIFDCSGTVFASNTAYDNAEDGFSIGASVEEFSNNTLINNSAYLNGGSGFSISADSDNTLADNAAYNNTEHGFFLFETSNNTLTGNTAYNHLCGECIGFFVTAIDGEATNNTLIENTACSNDAGIVLTEADNNTLIGNTLCDNALIGAAVASSEGASLTNDHFYNNTFLDFLVTTGPTIPSSFSMSGAIFDNPAGNLNSFTNLSINDSVSLDVGYGIAWSSLPAPLPIIGNDTFISFRNKFVNITALGGSPQVIDSIAWHWRDAELIVGDDSFIEGRLGLWKFNSSGWTLINATPNTVANTLSLSNVSNFSTFAILHNGSLLITDPDKPRLPGEEPSSPSCTSDEQCAVNEQCISGECQRISCDCGTYQDHQCVEYECCSDSDCETGESCQGNVCTEPPEKCEPPSCCTSTARCAGNEICIVPQGAATGRCEELMACGLVENHTVVESWECGGAYCPECPEGTACVANRCVQNRISCPSVGFVGDGKTCQAKENGRACQLCEYEVTDPLGKKYGGRTDLNGNFVLPLDLEGVYKIALIKDGDVVDALEVRALPRAPLGEAERPTITGEEQYPVLWLVLIVLLIALAAIYRSRKKGGGKPLFAGKEAGGKSTGVKQTMQI